MSQATRSALWRWFTAGGPGGLALACIAATARAQSELPPGFRKPSAAPSPFAASQPAPGAASPWLEFTLYMPPAIVLGAIFLIVLGTLLVAHLGIYRLTLRPNVRMGIHPSIVANSVMVWTAGTILLATYFTVATFAAGTIGNGYFTVFWAIVVLAVVLLTLFRRVIARWGLVLLAVLTAVALMLAFEIF